ncbi:helix-turn-helix domain-containing protein [Streptomyces sioyaensis]|uniref:helix-turn-helix domain-containing protein n=1 Tax=Streptomyces sioyaensis TaxID=67364 RepID=UPI0037977C6C
MPPPDRGRSPPPGERAGKKLTAGHVRVAADALGVSERTVWRWLAAAESDETAATTLASVPGERGSQLLLKSVGCWRCGRGTYGRSIASCSSVLPGSLRLQRHRR